MMSEEQTLLILPSKQKSLRKHRICACVSIFCSVLFLGIAIGFPLLIDWALKSQAEDGIVMTPDNQNLWAHVPGGTDTQTHRNFTFFNFTNPQQVLYNNAKPVFKEISGYAYLERQDFNDIEYLDDGNEVKFNMWLHFDDVSGARDPNQKVKTINLGPLGFWYQLKTTDMPSFTIQGLGQLYFELRDTFKATVVGQGVSQQFLPDQATLQTLTDAADISLTASKVMWNDPLYGLNDPNNFEIWISAAQNRSSSDYKILLNYFGLEPQQLLQILDSFESWSGGLSGIIDNWYCGGECSNQDLIFLQISQSGVTGNPPPGTDPTDSICDQNITCVGHPQISSYLKHVFPKQYPDRTDCFNLKFTKEEVARWMTPSHEKYCLLHAGNLNYIWQTGRKYDTGEEGLLDEIRQRFVLNTKEHAFVFWNWIKDFTYEFVIKKSKQGDQSITGIGGIASQALYGIFSQAQNMLGDLLLQSKLSSKLSFIYPDCRFFFSSQLSDLTQSQLQLICQDIDFRNSSSLSELIDVCEFQFTDGWERWKKKTTLTDLQMIQMCDRQGQLYGAMAASWRDIEKKYGCGLASKCSDYELAVKQWVNSSITNDPIPELRRGPSLTLNSWFPDIPAFEYSYFLHMIGNDSTYRPNITDLKQQLSFDCLFSGPVIQEMLLEKNRTRFIETYNWSEPELLFSYLKFVAIEVGLGGITQQRSVRDLLFGYEDDFLRDLRDQDPAAGGDPSISILVALNEPNSTKQQAELYPQSMYTGKSNKNITRYYKTINGKTYINNNYSYWDGDNVLKDVKSPWKQDMPFIGTDAFQNPPGLVPDAESNNLTIYITTLYRWGTVKYNKTIQKYDMDVYVAYMSPQIYASQYDYPSNTNYYSQYQCFLNISSVNGAPLFVSKNHFCGCPSNWSTIIDMYDQNQTFIFQPSIYDQTYMQIQPFTGTTFGATIYLQTSYMFKQDGLFERNATFMLPIFSLWRSGNISDHAVDQYFGDLRVALVVKQYARFGGIVVGGLFVLFSLGIILKIKKLKKKQQENAEEKSSMAASVQNDRINESVAQQSPSTVLADSST